MAKFSHTKMQDNGKRTIAVTVRMTENEARKFEEAALRLWHGAVMSRAQMLLSFAKLGLSEALKKRRFGP